MYEYVCKVCKVEEDAKGGKQKDKFQRFKEQKGVYVGESVRSIFEHARENRQDAADGSEDCHIIKHWKVSHTELQKPPQFHNKVVASFRDALNRQLSEGIRIDLKRGNVGIHKIQDFKTSNK